MSPLWYVWAAFVAVCMVVCTVLYFTGHLPLYVVVANR